MIPTFVADVHLGKLARMLRTTGFDVLYSSSYSNSDMADLAVEQKRIALTKARRYTKCYPEVNACQIESSDPMKQCQQVITLYHLQTKFQPFSRCLVCNHTLESVSKENIISLLPQQTSLYYHEFWQCPNCKRIYWKGPHYGRMMSMMSQLQHG